MHPRSDAFSVVSLCRLRRRRGIARAQAAPAPTPTPLRARRRGAHRAAREAAGRDARGARGAEGRLRRRRDRREARRRSSGRSTSSAQEIESDEDRRGRAARRTAADERRRRPDVRSGRRKPDRRYGLGLAAAKVYGIQRASRSAATARCSTELRLEEPERRALGRRGPITVLRAVVYLGYKFDQHFVLNTEIEYENAVVASDKGGEAEVEFAYIDYMHSRAFNARAGLVLIPMGLVNELHEPTAFLGARRPDVEDVIIPTTWREIGAGFYGEAGPFSYRGYVRQRPERRRLHRRRGHPRGPQEGSEALAENWAFTGPARLRRPCRACSSARRSSPATPGRGASRRRARRSSGADDGLRRSRRLAVARALAARPLRAHDDRAGGAHQRAQQLRGRRVGRQPAGGLVRAGRLRRAVARVGLAGVAAPLRPLRAVRHAGRRCPPATQRNPENDMHGATLGLAFQPIDRLIFKADWQQRHNAARDRQSTSGTSSLGYIF